MPQEIFSPYLSLCQGFRLVGGDWMRFLSPSPGRFIGRGRSPRLWLVSVSAISEAAIAARSTEHG